MTAFFDYLDLFILWAAFSAVVSFFITAIYKGLKKKHSFWVTFFSILLLPFTFLIIFVLVAIGLTTIKNIINFIQKN